MRFFLPLLLLSLLCAGCGSEPEVTAEEAVHLEGRWELTEARRDNVKTGLLDGLYFDFGPEGAFETNLLTGEAQSGSWEREGEQIITSGVELPLTYEIQALKPKALNLRARHEGFLFDFALERSAADPQ
ncbi:hypothetical protein GGR26_000432 [Lewinella marina]|uniref:Lipocalin-like domain-containing protein n=1 Tax=Neolewinella marina TaxID=438751 RepID=A0A2G0CJJ3_9BACT|nr:hypothetical protein [Neolewinella marina]NJB84687.1 hypothetical protein [Neolewinella marina]PHL00143.1 hypothetical protein CGL56_03630 [Neolewinella marina]